MSAANFRRGVEAAEEASKSQGGGRFNRLDYFTIKDAHDPTRIVRFITDADAWISTTMHPNMPTRPAPAGYTGKWPESMGCVCRMDSYKGQRTFPEYADCFHCITPDSKGKPRRKNDRTWAIGILRQQNPDKSFSDVMRDVTITKDDGTEETTTIPHYVVFCQAWSNFWTTINDHYKIRGTILDRDWMITRKGFTMNDTDYGIVPLDPVNVMLPGKTEPQILDFRDEEILAFYTDIPDLGEFVADQASDEYYDKFFDTRHPQPAMKGSNNSGTADASANAAATVSTPSTEPAPAAVSAIADRLQGVPGIATGYGAQAGTTAPASTGPLSSLPPQS